MHNYLFICMLSIAVIPYSNNLYAQEKFEKECRIKRDEVPGNALQFIDSFGFKSKIKWYKEEGMEKKSIEAKLKHQNVRYSFEFDSTGVVEDIETEVKWNELDTKLKESISLQLKKDCLKYAIVKVQKQHTGSELDLLSILKTNKNNRQVTINYELVVKCHLEKETALFEYLFSEEGKQLSVSKIVFKNSSHLEY